MTENMVLTCRRMNYIQAAMVQAALSIQHSHGKDDAIAILQAENLSEEVIARILSPGGPRRLSPYTALESTAAGIADDAVI